MNKNSIINIVPDGLVVCHQQALQRGAIEGGFVMLTAVEWLCASKTL